MIKPHEYNICENHFGGPVECNRLPKSHEAPLEALILEAEAKEESAIAVPKNTKPAGIRRHRIQASAKFTLPPSDPWWTVIPDPHIGSTPSYR